MVQTTSYQRAGERTVAHDEITQLNARGNEQLADILYGMRDMAAGVKGSQMNLEISAQQSNAPTRGLSSPSMG